MRDERGVTAVVFALAAPLLVVASIAAVEYSTLTVRRSKLQLAADNAALAAGREMGIAGADDSRVVSVAKAVALATLASGKPEGTTTTVNAAVAADRSGVQVSIAETVQGTTAMMLTLPSMQLQVKAAARVSGKMKLCVLGLDPTLFGTVLLERAARLTAERCSVHSNSQNMEGLVSRDYAFLRAERICTAGGYSGKTSTNLYPTPVTDCPAMADPLEQRPAPTVFGCDHFNRQIKGGGEATLSPGVYCGGLKVMQGSRVTLNPGVYIMVDGPLWVDGNATFVGENVGFYFRGDLATLTFGFDTTINLSAPKVGAMAGILFFEDRNAPLLRKFRISSANARRLLGTIYLPRGTLEIDANKPVADMSDYTVIVARQLRLNEGPNLVLNASYGTTDVPVPEGVGPVGPKVSLAQ